MHYEVRVEHEETHSIFQTVMVGDESEWVVMGWNTEDTPNAGWMAQDCCDRHNAKQWGKFAQSMLPILGVMWHEFDSEVVAEDFVEWAEYITKNDRNPCEAFVMGREEGTGKWEVKVRNW